MLLPSSELVSRESEVWFSLSEKQNIEYFVSVFLIADRVIVKVTGTV